MRRPTALGDVVRRQRVAAFPGEQREGESSLVAGESNLRHQNVAALERYVAREVDPQLRFVHVIERRQRFANVASLVSGSKEVIA